MVLYPHVMSVLMASWSLYPIFPFSNVYLESRGTSAHISPASVGEMSGKITGLCVHFKGRKQAM